MARQTDNLLFFDSATGQPTSIGNDSVALSGDLEIGGNLSVLGTMTYVDSEILTSDAYLLMNSSYTGITNQNGGFVINTKMTSPPGSLVSVTASTNTVVIVGTHALSAGDIFALVNTNESRNDSLYEVASASDNGVNTTVVLKSTITSGYAELLRSSSDLVDETSTSGAVGGKVQVAVLRSDAASGRFEYGFGSSVGITFADIAASSLDLQTAYENGATIAMTAAGGAFDVSPAAGQSVAISLDASAPSNFNVSGSDALTLGTNSGQLNLSSSTGNIIASTANSADVKIISGASEGATDVFGRLLLDGNSVSLLANGASAVLSLAAQGNVNVNTGNGSLTFAATGGTGGATFALLNDFEVGSDDINLNASTNAVLQSGASTTNAGGTLDIKAHGNDLTIATLADLGTSSTVGQMTIDANKTGGTALLIDSEGAMSTTVDNGAYTVVTNRTTVPAPISLTSTGDELSLTAGQNLNLITTGSARDVVISSIGTLPGLAESGNGGEIIVRSDFIDVDTHSVAIDATTHGALNNATVTVNAEDGITLGSSAGDITATVANTKDIKLLSGNDGVAGNVFGRLLLDGGAVSLKASGNAGGDLTLEGDDTVSITAATNGLTATATAGSVAIQSGTTTSVLSGSNMTLTSGGTFSATSTGSSTVSATNNVLLRAQATGANQSTLTIQTDDNGNTAGALAINAGRGANMTTANGDLLLQANNGDLNIQALNGGTASEINLSTNTNNISVNSGLNLLLTADTGSGITLTAGNATLGTGTVQVTTNALTATTGSTTLNSTGNASVTTTGAGAISLTSNTSITSTSTTTTQISGTQVVLKGSSSTTSQQVQLKNDLNAAVVEVERDSTFTGARLNQSVTVGKDLPNIAGVSDVGVGLRVTVEAGVDIGHILAVNANARFDKALARRASGGSELPQNPIGVALAPGQAAATTSDVFMSTVHGATVLLQLDSAPASTDVGKVIYMSPTTAGKGTIPANPLSLVNNDGLTRIATLGYLLDHNAITVTGIGGANVSVYPVLWMQQIVLDS